MNKNIINNARRDSIKKEKKRIIRRRRKIINYIVIAMLIASILTNIFLINKLPPKAPTTLGEITYGQDYNKEFQDTYPIVESYIKSCIIHQISNDTHKIKDENEYPTDDYYYNFTNNYNKELFNNLEILYNQYEIDNLITQKFIECFNKLSDEEIVALILYYGIDYVNYENNKEDFKNRVSKILEKEKDWNEEEIKIKANTTVGKITMELLEIIAQERNQQEQKSNGKVAKK